MRLLLALACLALLSGCATTGDPRDPLEPLNRRMFAFNEGADRLVLKPIAEGYQQAVPAPVRQGVNNFYGNIEDVATGLNNILQGKPSTGVEDLGRFVINTTLGIFGLWDVATWLGLEKHSEDFGQTLGVWGFGPGPYLVLPLLGPSTVRDAPARAVDPSWYYDDYMNWEIVWGTRILDVVRTRANLLQAETVLREAALDRYTFVRDAWLQRRRSQIYDGRPPREKEE
jgi:phospholipid-binding lipoprotein MlaA